MKFIEDMLEESIETLLKTYSKISKHIENHWKILKQYKNWKVIEQLLKNIEKDILKTLEIKMIAKRGPQTWVQS